MRTLVIGAGGTIGHACVIDLLSNGEVLAADINQPQIAGAIGSVLDVTDAEQVNDFITESDAQSQLSGVIYAAGLNTTGPLDQVDWHDYERVMSVNLRGAFHVGSALLKVLRKTPRNFSSVFISSTAGLQGEAGGTVYCASKFALIGFTQSFAGEIAPFGGRANVVCPGNVDSPMLSQLAAKIGAREGKSGEEVLTQWKSASSLKRLIRPAEVAKSCSWLLSEDSSGLSGQTIVVDGARA